MLGTLLTGPSIRKFGPRGHTVLTTSSSACASLVLGQARSNAVAVSAVVPIALGAGKTQATSARIVEDILRFPAALDAIIKAKGAKLEGANIRSGRRRPRTQKYEYPTCPAAAALTRKRWEELDPEGSKAIAATLAAAAPKKRKKK